MLLYYIESSVFQGRLLDPFFGICTHLHQRINFREGFMEILCLENNHLMGRGIEVFTTRHVKFKKLPQTETETVFRMTLENLIEKPYHSHSSLHFFLITFPLKIQFYVLPKFSHHKIVQCVCVCVSQWSPYENISLERRMSFNFNFIWKPQGIFYSTFSILLGGIFEFETPS